MEPLLAGDRCDDRQYLHGQHRYRQAEPDQWDRSRGIDACQVTSGRLAGVIVEHAVLPIRPGSEAEFEAAFATARPLISVQPGFRGISMSRSMETPNLYLLLVQWDNREAHTEGFRKSPEFEQWRALLHGFYESPPVIEHFVGID